MRKRLEGNPGKRPLPVEPDLPSMPDTFAEAPPAELETSKVAMAEWSRLAPMLWRIRLVTDADRNALIACCLEWARYLDATKKIADLGMIVKAPSGYPMPNPYLAIATKALFLTTRLWAELGLTPSSRSRVVIPPDAADAFGEFDVPTLTGRSSRPVTRSGRDVQ